VRCIWSSLCHCHPNTSYFIKIQTGLTFLVPAYPGCPGKEDIKQMLFVGIMWPLTGLLLSTMQTLKTSSTNVASPKITPTPRPDDDNQTASQNWTHSSVIGSSSLYSAWTGRQQHYWNTVQAWSGACLALAGAPRTKLKTYSSQTRTVDKNTHFHSSHWPVQLTCLLTTLQPFYGPFRDHLGEPVPEQNFWTLWCKGRLTEAYTLTIRMGATPSGLTSAYLHHAY